MAGKFRREVALQYAADKGIEVPEGVTDKALERIIRGEVGEQEYVCDPEEGGCKFPTEPTYVGDDDKYCWRCGWDCSENSDGGYDKLFGGSDKKKVNTIDRTGESKTADKKKGKDKPGKPGKKTNTTKTTAVAKKEPEPEKSAVPLTDRVEEIRRLDASTGAAAWRIGQHLVEISETEQWREMKYKDMDAFLDKELSMKRPTAYMYVRIAERFDEEEAAKLSVFKLDLLGRTIVKVPDKERPKLLKAALPKSEGGKGLDRDALTKVLNDAREKVAGEDDNGDGRGRPRKSKLSFMVHKKKSGKKEGAQYYVCLDDKEVPKENRVWVEIEISGDKATLEFCQFASE